MEKQGYQYDEDGKGEVQLVFNFVDPKAPTVYRRKGKGTFVVTVGLFDNLAEHILKEGYPLFIRFLGNLMIYLDGSQSPLKTHFITLEQRCYCIQSDNDEAHYFESVYERLKPLATSKCD